MGDMQKQVAIDLVLKTLASLPLRKIDKEEFSTARRLDFDMPLGDYAIRYDGAKGDNAFGVVAWNMGTFDVSMREGAALFLLSKILENRVNDKIRQELGKSYSPMVNYQSLPAYDDVRFLRADVDCLAEDAQLVLELTRSITQEFLRGELSSEEVERAAMPLQDSLKAAWRDDQFLATMVLSGMYEYENSVQYALMYRDGILLELTPDELMDAARKFIKDDRRLSVALIPSIDADGVGESQVRAVPMPVAVEQ